MDKRKINKWKWKKGRNLAEVIQNRVLRNIFGSRRDDVSGDWRRLHTEEINDLYCLTNVIQVIISRRTKCVGIWRRWGRGIYGFWWGNLR
jgi:hypothetical protein